MYTLGVSVLCIYYYILKIVYSQNEALCLIIFMVDVIHLVLLNILYSCTKIVFFLLAEELSECDFKSGFCGWTSVGENDKWKLSSNTTFAKYPGSRVCDERFNLLTV